MATQDLINELISLGGTPPANAGVVPNSVIEQLIADLRASKDSALKQSDAINAEITPQLGPTIQNAANIPSSPPNTPAPDNSGGQPQVALDYSMLNRDQLDALAAKGDQGAVGELGMRRATDQYPLTTTGLGNLGKQAILGLASMADVPGWATGLYGTMTSPIEKYVHPLGAQLNLGSQTALNYSQDEAAQLSKELHIRPPETPLETAANLAPNLLPVPGPKGGALGWLGKLVESMTPGIVGSYTPGKVLANAGVQFGIDQTLREATDNEANDYKTIFDQIGIPDAAANTPANPEVLPIMGLMGAATIVAPWALARLKTQSLHPPTPKLVSDMNPNAPPGLETIEKSKDLWKTYLLDNQQPLSDLAYRAGVPNAADLTSKVQQHTLTAASAAISEMMNTGTLRTPTGSVTLPQSPNNFYRSYKKLPPDMQQNIDTYLKLLDYSDDLKLQVAHPKGPPNAAQELNNVHSQIAYMNAQSPMYAQMAQGYRMMMDGMLDYHASGPYALFGATGKQAIQRDRPNYVPWSIDEIDPTDPLLHRVASATEPVEQLPANPYYLHHRDFNAVTGINDRQNAMDALIDYMSASTRFKMQSDVRGAYVDGMLGSPYGANTIIPAKPGDLQKYPRRVIQVYRGGKLENYIGTSLTSQLLQFDPYVAKHPFLYYPKRFAEQTFTGPLNLPFSARNAIRDTIQGWITAPTGADAPTPLGVLRAISTGARARTAKAISDAMMQSLDAGQPLPFISPVTQRAFATSLSNHYLTSLEHLAATSGGIGANLNTTPIVNGHRIMTQIAKEAEKIPVPQQLKLMGYPLGAVARGWTGLFSLINDAPRMAAFEKLTSAGVSPEEAASRARQISGDTTKSGMVYDKQGVRMTADATDKGAMAFAKPIGGVTEFAREAFPYFNPAVQALRRTVAAATTDPVRFNLRAWTAIGLPALASYFWNNGLGPQYNDFANNGRSDTDRATRMYIGIPGKRPEEGLQIDIPQEFGLYAMPYQAALNHLAGTSDELHRSLMHAGASVLMNALPVSYPPALGMAFNLAGFNAPDSVATGGAGVYELSGDGGILPGNTEIIARNLFGTVGDIGTQIAHAFAGEHSLPDAVDEAIAQYEKRTPIVNNVTGSVPWQSNFTELSAAERAKMDAYTNFIDKWDQYFNPKKPQGMLRANQPAGGPYQDGVPGVLPGPLGPKPTNPIYPLFGEQIKSALGTNDEGMTAMKEEITDLGKQIKVLTGFNSGNAKQFKAYQEMIEGAPARYDAAKAAVANAQSKDEAAAAKEGLQTAEEQVKLAALLKDHNIDLSNRYDVTRFVSLLRHRQVDLTRQQLSLINSVEDTITQKLQAQGIFPAGRRFQIDRDLGPFVQ